MIHPDIEKIKKIFTDISKIHDAMIIVEKTGEGIKLSSDNEIIYSALQSGFNEKAYALLDIIKIAGFSGPIGDANREVFRTKVVQLVSLANFESFGDYRNARAELLRDSVKLLMDTRDCMTDLINRYLIY